MAVLGRLLVSSGERIDLPDLLSIDSYSAGDWQYFMKTMVGEDSPYIIKGFDVINPAGAIGTQSCSINIASSAMYYPGSSAGSFFYGLPSGDPNAQPLVPELRKSATNYVYLTFTTNNTSADTRAFWDPNANGGIGSEFTQEINTESVIQVQVNVSTSSFPDNTVPVAIIVVGASTISSIEDARPLMYRLGSGGISPNPSNRFSWAALPTNAYERVEPPVTITSAGGINPFQGADKNITSLKQWMDAIMSKIAELGGTQYWYNDTSTFTMVNVFHDALTTTFKSKGQYLHSSATAGQLSFTEDVQIISASDPRVYIIRSGSLTLANEQVGYLPLVRNQPINATDSAVSWTNGQSYVNTPNGSIGFFANINQGDWIKKVGDDNTLFLRVEQFYDTTNAGGSTTTPANAKSILLNGAYQGVTSNDIARYDQGIYQAAAVQVQARSNSAISSYGGNFCWLALRSDTILGISSIAVTTVSGTLDEATGTTARITATAHGLVNGDRVTLTAPAAQAGTYSVDVADVNTFFINTTNTTTGACTAYYGLLTTAARTNGFGLQLESADHGFESGETIAIAGTTNYNSTYVVNYRSATQVQFPIGGTFATETVGTATLARMDVRTERGVTKIVQGETINIGENDSENIQSYLGMSSLAQTSPVYEIPGGYNTLQNGANFNSSASDNITARVSKLTAMAADKAQDKTLKYLSNATSATNTTSGSNQLLSFSPASSTLTILQPGSPGNAVVSLPQTGVSSWTLAVNQSAYVSLNRNAASTPSVTIANTSAVPVDENVIVLAARLSDTNVWLWNGVEVEETTPLAPNDTPLVKAKYYDPASTTLPIGNPVTEDGSSVNAGELVLFGNLGSGNNQVYMANGTGTNITGWTAQHVFNGSLTPSSGDTVIIQEGTAFKDQVGKFNDTNFVFNDKIRLFNGTDYLEQGSVTTSTLVDATTNGTVFTVTYAGSENMIIDFSLVRGTARETGTMYITTDGTNVSLAMDSAYINTSGVSFSGSISAGNFNLLYTTTATGNNATLKSMVRRWSNAAGGPAGVPSYSGSTTTYVGAGVNEAIQFNNAGTISGNSNFLIDATNGNLILGGKVNSTLSGAITLLDNISPIAVTLFSYSAATYPFMIIEFSIVRNGTANTGLMLITSQGSSSTASTTQAQLGSTGITLGQTNTSGTVAVNYTSTSTGFNGTFKYSIRAWS